MSYLGPNAVVEDMPQVPNLALAHGITMGLSFLILFPAGAIFIRVLSLKQTMWIHASSQMIGWVLMLAGFGTGMRLGNILDNTGKNLHTIAGSVIVVGMLLQPWLGYLHHRRYLLHKRKTYWTHTHVWFGRVLMLLGIVNGGIGFSLASGGVAYSQTGMIVYAVFAGLTGVVLISLVIYVTRQNDLKLKGNQVEAQSYDLNSHE